MEILTFPSKCQQRPVWFQNKRQPKPHERNNGGKTESNIQGKVGPSWNKAGYTAIQLRQTRQGVESRVRD